MGTQVETKYSAAPWDHSDENYGEIRDAHGHPLARLIGRQKSKANARLIAAAPTLLDYLISEHIRVVNLIYGDQVSEHKKAGCEVCSLVNRLLAFPRF